LFHFIFKFQALDRNRVNPLDLFRVCMLGYARAPAALSRISGLKNGWMDIPISMWQAD